MSPGLQETSVFVHGYRALSVSVHQNLQQDSQLQPTSGLSLAVVVTEY